MIIRRGDIYYADLRPVIGSEQGGIRPVLVIQNDTGNRTHRQDMPPARGSCGLPLRHFERNSFPAGCEALRPADLWHSSPVHYSKTINPAHVNQYDRVRERHLWRVPPFRSPIVELPLQIDNVYML